MNDPAPSPPAGQRPTPHRPMPRLGGGIVWSDVLAKIEADQARRQADFKEPAEDLNSTPADSRKLTSPSELLVAPKLGASQEDGPRKLVRDALHAEIRGVLGDRPTCDHGTAPGAYCWPCAQRDRGTELRAYAAPVGAPPAAELRALADDLNTHGGLDETFVAALLQAAAGPGRPRPRALAATAERAQPETAVTAPTKPRRRKDHGVGAWLRTLRKQAGLSQVEVARRMGCERTWICHLERGSYDPRLSTIMRYGDAIGAHIHIGLDPQTKPAEAPATT